MYEPFNYFGNAVSTKDEIEEALYVAIDECEKRLNFRLSNDAQRDLAKTYFELFDVEELKKAEFLSFMHPQAFIITSMYELKLADIANKQAFKDGSAF